MQQVNTFTLLYRQDSRPSPYNTFHQISAQLTGRCLFKYGHRAQQLFRESFAFFDKAGEFQALSADAAVWQGWVETLSGHTQIQPFPAQSQKGKLARNIPDVVLYEASTEQYKFTVSPAPMNGDFDIDSSPYFAEKFVELVLESGTSGPFVELSYTHWLLLGPSPALPYWNGYFHTLESTNGYVRYIATAGFPVDAAHHERFTGDGLQLAAREAAKAYLHESVAKLPPEKHFRQGECIFGYRHFGDQPIAYSD